jgi:deoxyxylulose-5-phosphate synthase
VKSIKLRRKPSSEIPRRFGLTILDLARKNEKIVGLHPPMPQEPLDDYLERAFDVGIAEQHVTLSAGMATKVWLFLQHLLHFYKGAMTR